MGKYQRKKIDDKYFLLEVFQCPKEIILFAAQLGSEYVTIENYTKYGRKRAEFYFEILFKNLSLKPILTRFDIDFSIVKNEFIQFIDVWDEQGCYAVFCDKNPLKFIALNLTPSQRYKTLENFGWTLELAIPGSASDGWGHIVSPNEHIINKIEQQLILLPDN